MQLIFGEDRANLEGNIFAFAVLLKHTLRYVYAGGDSRPSKPSLIHLR